MVIYTAEVDPLCYEGTVVLRNKLNLRTQVELDEFELAMFLTRAGEPWPPARWIIITISHCIITSFKMCTNGQVRFA